MAVGSGKRSSGLALGLLGLVIGLIAVGMLVAPAQGEPRSSGLGVFFLALIFGVPGGLLWSLGRRELREWERQEAFLGYLRSRSRIKLAEAAAYLGVAPIEAQRQLDRLVAAKRIDLVFSQQTDEYLHRADVEKAQGRLVSRCPSCGASVREQLILPGEVPLCSYCGKSLSGAS
ncbi:MAG: hypothetical protein QM765_35555 [Myxococcales bacterium]